MSIFDDTPEQKAEIQRLLKLLKGEVEFTLINAEVTEYKDHYSALLQIIEDNITDTAIDIRLSYKSRLNHFIGDSYDGCGYIKELVQKMIKQIEEVRRFK